MRSTRWCWSTALLILGMASAAVGQSPVHWQWNLDTAKQLAAQSNRLVLVHFWAEWCGPCQAMEHSVFSRPDVAAAMERDYVPCRLNLDQFPSTANQYGVTKIPTDVILTPQGRMVARFVGAADVSQYLDRIGRVAATAHGDSSRVAAQIPGGPATGPAGPTPGPAADAASGEFCRTNAPLSTHPQISPVNPPYAGQSHYPELAQGPQAQAGLAPRGAQQPPPDAQAQFAAQTPMGSRGTAGSPAGSQSSSPPGQPGNALLGQASPRVELPPGCPPLALDGYCPVQLTENERWVLGDRRWGVIHEGRTYLFAGPDEQNRFLADPTRYAPVFAGDDVVKLVDEGKRMPGNRLHGAWFHGKVYLFVNEGSYQQFDKNPFRYVSKLDAASATAQRPPLR